MLRKYSILTVIIFNSALLLMNATGNMNFTNIVMHSPVRDKHGIRYQLIKSSAGDLNWLFIPGGPGADSSYFLPLIEALDVPGKIWLIDLPDNGTNIGNDTVSFDDWLKILPACIKQFKNPIYVGHSFGGMIAFLFPEFEQTLKGLIIMSASPVYDKQEIETMRKARNIVISTEPLKKFQQNPTDKNFKQRNDSMGIGKKIDGGGATYVALFLSNFTKPHLPALVAKLGP